MGLALTTLVVGGRLDLAAAATFGTFAAVYGGPEPSPRRWRPQVVAALVLTGAVATGAVTATTGTSWLPVLVSAVWASAAAAASGRWHWQPAGPMFPVFAVATCSLLPVTSHSVLLSPLVCAATGAVAVGLGVVEARWWPLVGASSTARHEHQPHRRAIQAARSAVAVASAGTVATLVGEGHAS